MSLNIKNAETHQLVRELAELTGETQTTAVTIAVRDRLRAEPDAGDMAHAMERARHRRISAANWMETAVMIDGSRDPVVSRRFDELVQIAELQVEPVTHGQASGHKAG